MNSGGNKGLNRKLIAISRRTVSEKNRL